MGTFFQWDIWQVDWKHEDGTSKDRPAILISPSTYNREHDGLWFVKVSSQHHRVPNIIELAPGDPAFPGTGLTKKSYIYVADIQRIPKASVLYYRGALNRFSALMLDLQIRRATGWSLPGSD